MFTFFIPVVVLCCIATFLTVLLVVAERFLANHGEYTIDINDGNAKVKVGGGKSLFSALAAEEIFLPKG